MLFVLQPSNEAELCNAVATAVSINDRPSCFRFPRGNGLGVDLASYGVGVDLKGKPWELGKGVVRRQGKDVALVGYGTSVNDCLAAADMLAERGIQATVTDMRWVEVLLLQPPPHPFSHLCRQLWTSKMHCRHHLTPETAPA